MSFLLFNFFRLYSESREFLKTLQLYEHFNKPNFIKEPNAIENLLRGLTTQKGLQNDLSYEPDVRFDHSKYIIICSRLYTSKNNNLK